VSYHVPPVHSPDAINIVRDEMFELLRVKWDLRWYFLSPFEFPDGSPQDMNYRVLGATMTNDDEVVSDYAGQLFLNTERD